MQFTRDGLAFQPMVETSQIRMLVTGAAGFIGSAVVRRARQRSDMDVIASVRSRTGAIPDDVRLHVADIGADSDWTDALEGVDVLVHAAARVHVMRDRASNPLAEFRRVNVGGTLALARHAARAGVQRFIFISSIKVNGEQTAPDKPFTADDTPRPEDAYAISKLEAENGLRQLAAATGMEVTIIRPVLVYGPGVRANFLSMMRWLHRGIPLPLGRIDNRRSLVALDNLVDLIMTCVDHPAAANSTLLVSDGEDLSTSSLLRRVAHCMNRPARLLPVRQELLMAAARLTGRAATVGRLCGWLHVDIQATRELLGWTPPVSVDQALAATVQHFLEHGHAGAERKASSA